MFLASGFDTVFKSLSPFHEWGHQSRDIWLAYPKQKNRSTGELRIDPDKRPIDHPGLG